MSVEFPASARSRSRTREPYPPSDKTAGSGRPMFWFVLFLSGVLEAVWATALAASDGFRRPRPTIVFAISLLFSMVGLAWAMTGLPAGTAYAVWVGIGAVGTVLLAVARGQERLDLARGLLLLLLVGCVAGLKAVA
jgi:quaternary ammonium compound-resistance protein SugE